MNGQRYNWNHDASPGGDFRDFSKGLGGADD